MSCWGGIFEDMFVDEYHFDRPAIIGMVSAVPRTNGSPFFIKKR